MFVGHMRVNLCSVYIGVAEHGLDTAKVGAVSEKVGGENVAEGMGCNFFGNAGFDSVVFDHSFHGPAV